MEKFKVNKNSWHYKLVNEHVTDKYPYDLREKAMPTNFCAYWRRVVIECMKNSIATILVVGSMLLVLGGLGYLIYLAFAVATIADFAAFALVLLFFAALVYGMLLPDILRKRKIKQLEKGTDEQPSNIFVTKYKSWKGKYCPAIEYERN
jgi:preprotein translocase subunit Sss1